MMMLRKKETSIVSLVMLVALAVAPRPIAAASKSTPVLAQPSAATTYPLPANVPVGTTIRIGGSSSMETINQTLKQRFEQQFVGTKVELNTQGTGPALKDVLDGTADLAAIGRSLTDQERVQGLVQVPVSRHKIAIIVGSENPFKGSLTFSQFAKIFRGEIKDWSQVGGVFGSIRFVDRPDNSDTRQAFRNYRVFKQAPFITAADAQRLAQDSTSQVIQALGKDGIGYAIVDQLSGRGDVRVIPMHKTLPSSPKYPFSQPLVYVYKGPQPNPAAQAFLGYATAPISRQAIETARKQEAIAPPSVSPEPTVSSEPTVPTTTPSPQVSSSGATVTPSDRTDPGTTTNRSVPWWLWLLAIPLLGGLWWLLKRGFQPEPDVSSSESGIPEATIAPVLPVSGGEAPIVETVPAPLIEAAQPAGNSRLILVPRTCTDADAYWEVPAEVKASLQQQGAQKPVLRLYDVTGVDLNQHPPESLQEFDCDDQANDRHVPIRTDDRDYIAELGYIAEDGRWLQVARSEPVHVPACPPGSAPIGVGGDVTIVDETPLALVDTPESTPKLIDDEVKIGGAALVGGATSSLLGGSGAATSFTTTAFSGEAAAGMVRDRVPESSPSERQSTSQSRIILVPRNVQSAYVYWEVSQDEKDVLKHQGGRQLVLKVYEVTNTASGAPVSNLQQFNCNDWDQDRHVAISVSDRSYVAELGYLTVEGRFLKLATSLPTFVAGTHRS